MNALMILFHLIAEELCKVEIITPTYKRGHGGLAKCLSKGIHALNGRLRHKPVPCLRFYIFLNIPCPPGMKNFDNSE
jgi:hypothetical protein